MSLQLKLGSAGFALSLMLDAGSVDAQQLGPFVQNNEKNPFYQEFISGNYKKLSFADLDNDGDQDVVIGINSGVLLYAENVGNAQRPRFIQRTGTGNPFDAISFSTYAAPELVDFDGDGDYDLIYAFQDYSEEVRYYQNTDFEDDAIIGNGPNFNLISGAGHPLQNVQGNEFNVKPTVGDLDDDGDLDIMLGQNSGPGNSYNPILYFENTGGFTTPVQFPGLDAFFGDPAVAPTFFDYDGDGDLDVVVGEQIGTIRYFKNTDLDPSDPTDVIIGDDIAFTELTGPGVNPFDGFDAGSNAVISFVDIDNDGDMDAFVGSSNIFGVMFLRNDGGVFNNIQGNGNPFNRFDLGDDTFPTFADIDGDGHTDAIVGEKFYNTLFHFRNMADGTVQEITGASNPFSNIIALSDFHSPQPEFVNLDNDSDLDLLLGLYNGSPTYSGEVYFHSNSGANVFAPATLLIDGMGVSQPFSSTFADLDGDGDFDAVIGVQYSGGFRYYRNTDVDSDAILGNNPAFNLETGPADPLNLVSIVSSGHARPELVDLDHDGDFDLAVGVDGGPSTGEVRFLDNGGFSFAELAGASNPFNGIDIGSDAKPALVDWDEDGDLDLFVGEAYGGIEFFENRNLPPQTNSNTPNSTFTEDNPPLAIDPAIALSDDTNDRMIQATISIVGNYRNGEDVLNVTLQGSATGSFDASTGVYTISGTGTLAEYQAMLQSATYHNSNQNPDTSPRTIEFAVTDFDNTDPSSDAFPEAQTIVSINSVNDAPVLTTSVSGSATFNENGTPVIIDPGVTVSDVDHTTLAGATVSITGNFVASEDVLLFTNQNGISGSYNAGTGVLTLSGSATLTDYLTALQSVTYQNLSENPNTTSRTLSFQADDGTDLSNIGTRTVNVTAVNDAPILSSPLAPVNYLGVPLVIDPNVGITDLDHLTFSSATVRVSAGTFVSGEDDLLFTNQNGITGSYNSGTGMLTLSGVATLADYQTALRSIQYNNLSGTPTTTGRVIDFFVNDGIDVSNITSISISIGVNQPPALTSSSSGVTYSGSPIIVDPTISVSDPDDASLSSATVRLSAGTFVSGEDFLLFSNQNGIAGTYNSGTGILALSGTASVANYQTALRSIQYDNTSSTPNATPRTIEFTVNDGTDASNTALATVNISTGSPPVISATTTNVNTGSMATVPLPPLVTDPDGDADLSTLAIIQTPPSGAPASINASDELVVDYSAGSFAGTEAVTIEVCDLPGNCAQQSLTFNVVNTAPSVSAQSQSATFNGSIVIDLLSLTADAESNLDPTGFGIIQDPTSGAPASLAGSMLTINYAGTNFAGSDAVTIEACNLTGTCTQAVMTITIANGAPSIAINAQTTTVNGSVSINLTSVISDPDNNLDPSTFQIVSPPISGALASITGGVLTIDYSNVNFAGTDELTIEACDLAGVCTQAVITIEVEAIIVNNAISPNGDGKNDTWQINNITSLGPQNTVSVFTRWGDKVFEVEDYNNTSVVFSGLSNNGNELANGVYFYRIEFKNGRETLTGYLLIKR